MRIVLAKGIDVSKHQSVIEWEKVASAGIQFAFIRIGYRGSASGKIVEDKYFIRNINGAIKNRLKVGIYFFSTAKNIVEVREEAYFTLKHIKGYEVTLPIVFDFEGYNNPAYRTYGITKEQRTANCKEFNSIMEFYGYNTMLYGSQGNIKTTYDLEKLTNYLWIARYAGGYTKILDGDRYFPRMGKYASRVAIWQYTSIGRVDGIKGNVDLDYMYLDMTDEVLLNTSPYKEPSGNVKYNVLTKNMVLESVKWVQCYLNKYGYGLDIDGKFGKLTLQAIKDFQGSHGLIVDGIVGKLTRAELIKGR